MKLPQQKKFFTPLRTSLLVAGIIAVAAVSAGAYFMLRNQTPATEDTGTRPVNTVDYGPPSEQDKQDGLNAKEETINQNNNPTPPPDSNQQTPTQSLNITVTRAGQTGAGQPVSVRTIVTGTTSGQCTMTFTKSGQNTVTKTFAIAMDATTATCNGDTPINNFGTTGDWQLAVVAKSADGKAVSPTVTQSVKIEK